MAWRTTSSQRCLRSKKAECACRRAPGLASRWTRGSWRSIAYEPPGFHEQHRESLCQTHARPLADLRPGLRDELAVVRPPLRLGGDSPVGEEGISQPDGPEPRLAGFDV